MTLSPVPGNAPTKPTFVVVDPTHFDVSYAINPWMRPEDWKADPERFRQASRLASANLVAALETAGARVEILPGVAGVPDLVFPANAAVVFEGKAVLGRFRHPERRAEEAINLAAFEGLKSRGLLREVVQLPTGVFHEGAGDFMWDASRGLFWSGYGQRSDLAGASAIAAAFGRPVVPLELTTGRFYHLDTCFCPLTGGEILYYPSAFTAEALDALRAIVPPDALIEASDDDAASLCVNAVCIGRTVVMSQATDRLRQNLTRRGYRVLEVDLAPFILSGGAAYCMSLRLDLTEAEPSAGS